MVLITYCSTSLLTVNISMFPYRNISGLDSRVFLEYTLGLCNILVLL